MFQSSVLFVGGASVAMKQCASAYLLVGHPMFESSASVYQVDTLSVRK